MSLSRFWWECLRRAFKTAFGTTGVVSLALTLAGGAVAYFYPTIGRPMNVLAWAIPLAVFAAFLVTGLIRAPYSIYREVEERRNDLQSRLDEGNRRREIRERLGQFLNAGYQLMIQCTQESQPPPNQEADDWGLRTEVFLRENLGESYVARFRSSAGLPMTATSITSVPHRQLWGGITTRMARLEQFIQELAS